MILKTLISVLLAIPFVENGPADTLDSSIIETSVKSVIPIERMSSPVTEVYMLDMKERGIDSPK